MVDSLAFHPQFFVAKHKREISISSQATTALPEESEGNGDIVDEPVGQWSSYGALPTKNTFIEFPVTDEHAGNRRRLRSAPSYLLNPAVPTSKLDDASLSQAAPRQRRRGVRITAGMLSTLGSAEFPTVGSAGHHRGKCKPCAFAWKEGGCESGVQCQFCHLCDAVEKKRRHKAKLQGRRPRQQ